MKLLWLSAHSCNGNVHSFLTYEGLEHFLSKFTFLYHPTLDSRYTLQEIYTNQDIVPDILIIEGTIEKNQVKFDKRVYDVIIEYANKASYIITLGTCSSFGGIFLESFEDAQGFLFIQEKSIEKSYLQYQDKTITLSGCPVNPSILVSTLFALYTNTKIVLDEFLRPKEFYGFTVHNGCIKNEYFEYKVDNYQYGNIEGCMFYEHGCQAPFTNLNCNKILWNGVSSKTRVGQPCFGCSMPDFPKTVLFKTKKNMGIPQYLPLGIPKRTYLTFAGVAKAFVIERLEKKIIE
jgi:Ni,Fe-hydrogenase I small subunit